MLHFIQPLKTLIYEQRYDYDYRKPIVQVPINLPLPGSSDSYSEKRFVFGVLFPSPWFWLKAMSMTFTNLVIASIVAYIIYFYVIPNRNSNNTTTNTYNYLLVYGILLPILFTIPFFLIDLFQVDNLIMALGTGFIPLVYCLRCSETTCGFSPKYVEISFTRYWLYFICPVSILFDDDKDIKADEKDNNKKPVKATRQDIRNKLWETVRDFILIGFFLSILIPRDFIFFSIEQKEEKEESILLFQKLFHPKHLFNNFIMAWLTNMILSSGMNIISLGINIVSSIKVIDVTQNPMFESSSPSDFWGNRWNKLVHQTLKVSEVK